VPAVARRARGRWRAEPILRRPAATASRVSATAATSWGRSLASVRVSSCAAACSSRSSTLAVLSRASMIAQVSEAAEMPAGVAAPGSRSSARPGPGDRVPWAGGTACGRTRGVERWCRLRRPGQQRLDVGEDLVIAGGGIETVGRSSREDRCVFAVGLVLDERHHWCGRTPAQLPYQITGRRLGRAGCEQEQVGLFEPGELDPGFTFHLVAGRGEHLGMEVTAAHGEDPRCSGIVAGAIGLEPECFHGAAYHSRAPHRGPTSRWWPTTSRRCQRRRARPGLPSLPGGGVLGRIGARASRPRPESRRSSLSL
jgi:hypothetical protein